MLDTETKRRIDSARDILVGKVPDPKSQVEQITIALIYKFMDDMDAESEELGGKRKFFAGEWERYGWPKLMRSGLGGHEVLALYGEAIAKMPQNAGIPPLFRDIFKNAYLPYRDPETLKGFLKIIDEFDYDHSERLGDAFEYLLSVLGSQGDAGQFRTPRHIIDFMVEVLDPKKGETVLDPACGTAGFLISAYKHILRANTETATESTKHTQENLVNSVPFVANTEIATESTKDTKKDFVNSVPLVANKDVATESTKDTKKEFVNSVPFVASTLTPDDKGRLSKNFKGYDISPDMVRLSLVNLYLHGFSDPHIYEYDTLTSEERWNEYADVILANPPFMSPKGGIKPHKRFSIQAKRSEVLFVDYMAEHLTPTGRAAIIVPEGIIFQSQNAYKQLRKMLVDSSLVAVISLPAGCFNPYSGVKTSVLLLDKALAKQSDSVGFFKVENDGYNLGAQRRAIEKNDLPQVQMELETYLNALRTKAAVDNLAINTGLIVPKDKIGESGDYNLSGERYRESIERVTTFPKVVLGELLKLEFGTRITKKDDEGTLFPVYGGGGASFRTDSFTREDDVVISRFAMSPECVREVHGKFYLLDSGFTFSIADAYIGRATKSYVVQVLLNNQDRIYACARGHAQKNIDVDAFKRLQIPLPSLDVQKEIVAEIEGYQKVIDGARAVLDHYRPHIPIHPDWPLVKLETICKSVSDGDHQAPPKSNEGIPFVTISNITSEKKLDFTKTFYVPQEYFNNLKTNRKPQVGDILYSVTGSYGIPVLVDFDEPFCFQRHIALIRPSTDVDNRYLFNFLCSPSAKKQADEHATGVAQKTVSLKVLRQFQIPLPPLTTQQAIVAEIEAEQALVAANRELITRFEQKIQATLARIWGDEKGEGE